MSPYLIFLVVPFDFTEMMGGQKEIKDSSCMVNRVTKFHVESKNHGVDFIYIYIYILSCC